MIKVSNITKTFGGFKANDDLSMTVEKGSVYGLVGPNGAGKTTIIKQIMGVYRPDSGSITIDGEAVYENTKVKERVICIPDELYFFQAYTIKDMAAMYRHIYPTWNQERFDKLSRVFKIDIKRKVSSLSKGMQKQVAFWLGISAMPSLMILDEPVDGLDPVMRRKVWSVILQDVVEREMTVLLSSHNLRELEDVCDHVGILHEGRVVLEKRLDDVKSDMHKLQVAFRDGVPEPLTEELDILHSTKYGSVSMIIVRGEYGDVVAKVNAYTPFFVDILPLTLEEVFIYELGGLGYESGIIDMSKSEGVSV